MVIFFLGLVFEWCFGWWVFECVVYLVMLVRWYVRGVGIVVVDYLVVFVVVWIGDVFFFVIFVVEFVFVY